MKRPVASLLLTMMPWLSLMTAPAVAASPLTVETLAGHWVATPEVNGQRGVVTLEFLPQADGSLLTELDMPPIEAWNLPVGPARIEGNVVVVGSSRFDYDPATGVLSGPLSRAIVPVYPVTAGFRRTDEPPSPSPASAAGPGIEPVWTKDIGTPVWSGVTVMGELLLVGGDDGRLRALATDDGTERWSYATEGALRARPTFAGSRIYLPSDDGELHCIDAATGTAVWRTRLTDGPAPRSQAGTPEARYDHFGAAVTSHNDVLYTATLAGEVLALDAADGAVRWRYVSGGAVQGTPAVSGDRVVFGSFDHHVYGLDAATGYEIWRFDAGAPVVSAPAIYEDLVIIGSRAYDLFGLDAATGEPRWRDYLWFSWIESSTVVFEDTAYVGSSDARQLTALAARSGQRRWVFTTAGSAWATPAVDRDAVYIGSIGVQGYISAHRGGFYAVERSTGRALWSFTPPPHDVEGYSGFASSPALDGQRVYVGGLDGRVYAFDRRP